MSTDIANISLSDMEKMANTLAKSGLFGIKEPTQALALMLVSQAEGLHPVIAARDYHIIDGRPSLKADAILARHQASGGTVRWEEVSHTRACGIFWHPAGGEIRVEWTLEDAKRAGLANRPVWQKYGRALLRSRCASEGVRIVNPGCICGTYTPEEVQSFSPIPKSEKEVTEIVEIVEGDLKEQEESMSEFPDEKFNDFVGEIKNCRTLDELKKSYIQAYKYYIGSPQARQKIEAIKEEKKDLIIKCNQSEEFNDEL